MKHALVLQYTTPSGQEAAMNYLRCDTTEARAESLAAINHGDVSSFLSADELAQLQARLVEGATETESLLVLVDETNYPLPIILPRDIEAFIGTTFIEGEFSGTEGPMCDGGPSRKETLKHAREAFKTIATLPEALTGILERISALESTPPGNPPADAVIPTAPESEQGDATPAPTDHATTESTTTADHPTDTPVSEVDVTSPLLPDPAEPTGTESTETPDSPDGTEPELTELTDDQRRTLQLLQRAGTRASLTL